MQKKVNLVYVYINSLGGIVNKETATISEMLDSTLEQRVLMDDGSYLTIEEYVAYEAENDRVIRDIGPNYIASIPPFVSASEVAETPEPALTFFSAQASTTPSTTVVTVASPYTGVEIYLGELDRTNPIVFLYVTNNSTTTKIKVHRWQKLSIRGTGTFAFGLADFRGNTVTYDLAVKPTIVTTSKPVPVGTSSSITTDQYVTRYYNTTQTRITLPTFKSAIKVHSKSSAYAVIIKEYDGTNWSPPHVHFVPANKNKMIRCDYKQITIATVDGSAVTVTTDGTINTTQYLPMPSYTVVRTVNVSTSLALNNAFSGIQNQDDIVVAPGNYVLSADVATSNITFRLRSSTGVASDVVITPQSGTVGRVKFTTQTSPNLSIIDGITFDLSTITAAAANNGHISFIEPYIFVRNVIVRGNPSTDLQVMVINSSVARSEFALVNSDVRTCEDDTISFSDTYTGATARYNVIANCVATGNGTDSNEQVLTSHGYANPEILGGTFSTANPTIAATGNVGAPARNDILWAYFTNCSGVGGVQDVVFFGSNWQSATVNVSFTLIRMMVLTEFAVSAVVTSTNNMISDQSTRDTVFPKLIMGNLIDGNNKLHRGILLRQGGTHIIGNHLKDMATPVHIEFASGANVTDVVVANNYFTNNTGIMIALNTFRKWFFNNVATGNSGTNPNVNATNNNNSGDGSNTLTADYNIWNDSKDSDYVLGAHDSQAAPQIGADLVPTAGGNCYGNGSMTGVTPIDWIGGLDLYGNILWPDSSAISKGCAVNDALLFAVSTKLMQSDFIV